MMQPVSTATATSGVTIRCTRCGTTIITFQRDVLKSSTLVACPQCAKYRLLRPAYTGQKTIDSADDAC